MTVGLEPLIADPDSLALAAAALRAGTVVAIPTDTVYGLAADPSQPQAVERLFALKKRPSDVALPVLVAGREQVSAVAGPLDGAAERLAGRYWPGPLTLVVPRRPSFTADLGGPPSARQTVGVRWPDHLVVQALCRELGPLAVTSANRHGGPPATRAAAVAEVFAGEPELTLILDGGLCDGAPSTVVEYRGTALRCLRRGAIPWSDLQEGARGEPDRGSGGPLGAVMPTARSQGSHVPDPLPSPKGPVD